MKRERDPSKGIKAPLFFSIPPLKNPDTSKNLKNDRVSLRMSMQIQKVEYHKYIFYPRIFLIF